jgi:hypothetical protein
MQGEQKYRLQFLSETLASIGCEPDWNKWPAALKAEYIILTLSEIDGKMLSSFLASKPNLEIKKTSKQSMGAGFNDFLADRTADEPANVITLNTTRLQISYLQLTELLPGEKELTQISKIFSDILYSILNSSKI